MKLTIIKKGYKKLGGISMKKGLIIIVTIAIGVSLAGCSPLTTSSSAGNKKAQTNQMSNVNNSEIFKPIDDKVKAINDKKVDDYLSSYISGTTIYKNEKSEKTQYLEDYTVKANVTDKQVLNKTDNAAQVQYVISTSKLKGPAFLDSKALYVSNLKKINGEWKISSESVLKIEFTNDVFNTVNDNILALNKKDINAYMATIDSTDTTVYSKFKDNQLDQFDKYSLTYTLESADIIGSVDDKDTAVKVVETIVKDDSSNYQNNRTTEMIQLKKVQGVWKIYKVEPKKTENLK